jgi:hypothetical protein
MATAVQPESGFDTTEVPLIVKSAIILGTLQAVIVFAVSLANGALEGTADATATGIIVSIGLIATITLPGTWTHARSIEGIAGAAGIGLGAAFMFLILDVILLQPLGVWTNRWYEVGGHSNWWYHPVWWMLSAFLAWQGAWNLANQSARSGSPSVPLAVVTIAVLSVIIGAIAATLGFPGAAWNVPTFMVAVLPALVAATLIGTLRSSRG